MLSVASQSSPPPYRAVTTGPVNHSPPPIAAPAMKSPGPSMAKPFRHVNTGGGGNSPSVQGGIC